MSEYDIFVETVNRLGIRCPVHDTPMTGKRVEIKTGLSGYVRKVMYIGKCGETGCQKWFEWTGGMVLWP